MLLIKSKDGSRPGLNIICSGRKATKTCTQPYLRRAFDGPLSCIVAVESSVARPWDDDGIADGYTSELGFMRRLLQ